MNRFLGQKSTDFVDITAKKVSLFLLWSNIVSTIGLLEKEAWQCILSIIIKKLEYPLPQLTLTKNECGELITFIKYVGLPHSSICQKFPPDLVHCTSDYLGIGMDELYIVQGSSKV